MKKLLFITALVILSLSVKAQGIFDRDQKTVKDTLLNLGLKFSLTDKSSDGNLYDTYIDKEGYKTACYFNKDGLCYEYKRFLGNKSLINTIEFLNENYISTGEKVWVNKSANVKVYLTIPEEKYDFYFVTYIYMPLQPKN